jgi:hypothetical protein
MPGGLARKLGEAAHDAPDHVFQALVDLHHVGAKGLLEQRLRTQVVPEAVHVAFVAQRVAQALQEAFHQLVVGGGAFHRVVVARDAARLVLLDAADDQVDLVAEVVVQHAVRELGVLRDLAQAGARVAERGQRGERGLAELGAALRELVDACLGHPFSVFLDPLMCRH